MFKVDDILEYNSPGPGIIMRVIKVENAYYFTGIFMQYENHDFLIGTKDNGWAFSNFKKIGEYDGLEEIEKQLHQSIDELELCLR